MDKVEKFGFPKAIVSFAIPTQDSFNLDGPTLYQSIAAFFIAQLYGIHLPLLTQINLMIVLMITAKGIAWVPGVSFVVFYNLGDIIGIRIEPTKNNNWDY